MKKRYLSINILSSVFLIAFLVFGISKPVSSQELSEDVAIAAIVQSWLYFEISSLDASLEPALVSGDGSFNIGSTSDINLSAGSNNDNGWHIEIRGKNGGLRSLMVDHLIPSVINFFTLEPGVEGYGINATSSFEGILIGEIYNYYGTNTVGEVAEQYRILASINKTNFFSEVVKLQIKATASILTPASGDYSDFISITIVPGI